MDVYRRLAVDLWLGIGSPNLANVGQTLAGGVQVSRISALPSPLLLRDVLGALLCYTTFGVDLAGHLFAALPFLHRLIEQVHQQLRLLLANDIDLPCQLWAHPPLYTVPNVTDAPARYSELFSNDLEGLGTLADGCVNLQIARAWVIVLWLAASHRRLPTTACCDPR